MFIRFFRNFGFLILFILTAFFPSCTSKKKLVYFQGKEAVSNSDSNKNYTPILHADDLLSITVMGLDPDAVKPFNLPSQTGGQIVGGYSQGAPTPPGYLVDSEGNIDFPVIGKIKVGGLDRVSAATLLKEKLGAYINNPNVMIRILNYKITVLGEVRNPGTFTIPNERISLPEALGISGDLLITAVRKNVLVIRDVDGKKTETRVDLTSKNLFSSPVYYLHQNDVVYVEPNRAKINSSVINASNVGIAISVLSLLITMITLLSRK
ncbi:MAG: polysaccharide biosynthesis/export family protein [Bacteroidetes bacterium]|nr:polysaccharide biosynthesis/export family protein [Bacteroidota bacterium]